MLCSGPMAGPIIGMHFSAIDWSLALPVMTSRALNWTLAGSVNPPLGNRVIERGLPTALVKSKAESVTYERG